MGCDLFPKKVNFSEESKNGNYKINLVNGNSKKTQTTNIQNKSNLMKTTYSEKEDFNFYIKNINKNSDNFITGSRQYDSMSINNFEVKKLISKGSFGKVYLVSNKLGKLYAMKVIKKDLHKKHNIPINNFYLEKFILQNIKSEYIPELKCSFQDENKLYLVTDFAFGGDLLTHIMMDNTFTVERSKFYICEIILAIKELHDRNIIYCDLKPENVLLFKNGHIKLTDFGISYSISKELKSSDSYDENNTKENENEFNVSFKSSIVMGSKNYIAPEMIKNGLLSKDIDWYALGVLFYYFLTGNFDLNNIDDKLRLKFSQEDNDVNSNSNFNRNFNECSKCIDFIKNLTKEDNNIRLGHLNDWEDVINHEYLVNTDFNNLKPTFIPFFKNKDTSNLKYFVDNEDESINYYNKLIDIDEVDQKEESEIVNECENDKVNENLNDRFKIVSLQDYSYICNDFI